MDSLSATILAWYAGPALLGYLLGSIPFGLVITKLAGLGDIRSIGSGNIGATNVLRTGRRDLAVATLLLDAAKAGLAYWVARSLVSQFDDGYIDYAATFHSIGLIAGAFAFVGHCYPVWLKFKGGKGVATFLGLLLAAKWELGLAFAVIWLATAAIFRISSLAALVATTAVPVIAWTLNEHGDEWIVTAVLAVLIFWRHRANIKRIIDGTEPKIGAKKPAEPAAPPGPAA